MGECPECRMRDDDWFLCRRDPCAVKPGSDELSRLRSELEAVKADNRRILEEHARIIEINKKHCATVNSYILDNSRQEDGRKAAEARAAQLEAENGWLREALERLVATYKNMKDENDDPCPDVAFARAVLEERDRSE